MFQNFGKNSFSRGESTKNGILVVKITFPLQKNPREVQVFMS